MAEILIRNIDEDVHARLKQKAAAQGLSLQAYLHNVLSQTAQPSPDEFLRRAARIRARSKPVDRPTEEIVQEMRDEREAQLAQAIDLPIK